mmetsp:Transcript_37633/g.27742  ORF Transcript_37633/g.27742 Transcript_37633/m.27742 type:complete len:87 (+) Transcript_37633:237-497(+)
MLFDQRYMKDLIIPCLPEVFKMIEKNLFRPLPNIKKGGMEVKDSGLEQEDEVDPAWPHLQGIYEFFLQLIVSDLLDMKVLKVYISH